MTQQRAPNRRPGHRPRHTERDPITSHELQRRINARFERLLARKYPGLRFHITNDNDATRGHGDTDDNGGDVAGSSSNAR